MMKKNSKLRKVNRHFVRYGWLYILVFPLVVGVLYRLPLPQIIALEPGELLAYYAVVFGLLGSYFKYAEDKKVEKREREKNAMPVLDVELMKRPDCPMLFDIRIRSLKESPLCDVYLYDELVCGYLTEKTKLSVSVAFGLNKTEEEELRPDRNITMDGGILDEDGYPKYIQIACDDTEGTVWVCEFDKYKTENEIVYRPIAPWIA